MAYEVTNDSTRTKAVKVPGGSVDVAPGATATVDADFSAEYIDAMGEIGVTIAKPKPKRSQKPKATKAAGEE